MDIIDRLKQLEASVTAKDGFVSQDTDVCRAAISHIRQLEALQSSVKPMDARFLEILTIMNQNMELTVKLLQALLVKL